MNANARRLASLSAACGAALGLTAAASAQTAPTVVNISGATLLENFFRSRASTVDYIDVDANGLARSFPTESNQQLAPFNLPGSFPANQTWPADMHWAVMYSAVGSTNGFQELINHGRGFVTSGSTDAAGLPVSRRTAAYYNRYRFILAGAANDDNDPEFPPAFGLLANAENPMAAPIRSETTFLDWPMNTTPNAEAFRALYTSMTVPSTAPNEGLTDVGGLTVDIAPLDVPTAYATTQPGDPDISLNPLQPGYGNNPRLAVGKDGAPTAQGNKLATLTGGANLYDPNVTPDGNTIFDTSILFAPVAPVVNFGVGMSQIDMSNLNFLFSTGRLATGENLMAVTRDSGSGTRNAWDNSRGIDPSWGSGENVGPRNNDVVSNQLGAGFLPSNKGGNNRVEPTVTNHRLAVGYVGPERGVEQAWLTGGRMEILAVRPDIAPYNGAVYARPTLDNVLDNDGPSKWVIGGPSVVATFGDPRSAPPELGGLGWMEPYTDSNANGQFDPGEPFNDINDSGLRDAVEPRPAELNPQMRNAQAAAYINNITRSTDAFVALPGDPQTLFTPGEYAATQYILTGALPLVQNALDPIDLIPNPSFNQTLQDFIRTEAGNVLSHHAYQAFGNSVAPVNPGNSRAGKVPARTVAPAAYSDQALVPAGDTYITEGGAILNYGANLPLRNLVAGDFSGDGLRNIDDAADLVGAFLKRTASGAWTAPAGSGDLLALASASGTTVPGDDFCIEISGDFNGDGSFDRFDLRYWADGLAIAAGGDNAGRLDRAAGFLALDTALAAATGGADHNLFDTTLATGKPYAPGDAAGNVANADGRVTPGFQPTGADGYTTPAADAGVINAADIDYVYAQFKANPSITDGEATWSDFSEAVWFDLSADIDGDLAVGLADVDRLVTVILGTSYGDVNLDGTVCRDDLSAARANLGAAGGWSDGDVNGDGAVTAADLDLITTNLCPADWTCDGVVNSNDISAFLTAWLASVQFGALDADVNNDQQVNSNDISAFLTSWLAGVGPGCN